jgi:hypothetical protein
MYDEQTLQSPNTAASEMRQSSNKVVLSAESNTGTPSIMKSSSGVNDHSRTRTAPYVAPSSSSSSSLVRSGVPSATQIWEQHSERDEMIRTRGIYSAAALAAVGLGFSPSKAIVSDKVGSYGDDAAISPISVASMPSEVANFEEELHAAVATDDNILSLSERLATNSLNKRSQQQRPSPQSALQPSSAMVSIKVHRAWDLPDDLLGGTNAYIVVDWGRLGRATTQAIMNSCHPIFDATLQFRSPLVPYDDERSGDETDGVDDHLAEYSRVVIKDRAYMYRMSGPMQVLLYNRNRSVSDELLGYGEFDPLHVLEDSPSARVVVHILDRQLNSIASVELAVELTT